MGRSSDVVGDAGQFIEAPPIDVPVAPPRDVSLDRTAAWPWCGLTFVRCDPGTGAGCAMGEGCVVDAMRPPASHCEVDSGRGEGVRCGDGIGACGGGLLCVSGRCVRACCYDSTRDECGEGSSCSVLTEATYARACTLRGECDYQTQSGCEAGAGCFPQSEFGESRCRPFGTARAGQRCALPNDCIAGHTCFYSAGMSIYCGRICDPERDADPTCDCVEFNDRPLDFGVCR